jgi:hypothetical protein
MSIGGFKQRAEVLEQDNREHWEAKNAMKGDVGAAVEVAEGNAEVKQDLRNSERELVKLKEEMTIMRAIRPKAEPLALPNPPKAGKPFPPSMKK